MNVAPRSVFITGCSRGIGLEIVHQLLNMKTPPKHIFANYRKDPDGLKENALYQRKKKLLRNIKITITSNKSMLYTEADVI